MSDFHNNYITDPNDKTRRAEVNSIGELRTYDPSSITLQSSSFDKLSDIEDAIQAVETNQTDKSQYTNLTDGTNEASINSLNEIYTRPIEYYPEVSKGNVSNASVVHKYGRNPDMASGVEEAICADGIMNFLSSATTVRIKPSGNGNDTFNGSGAREVTIEGSNASGEFISESVVTAGAYASDATINSFLRVYRAYVSSCGTYVTTGIATNGSNQGNIVIEDSGGTTDLIQISQYEGQTQYAGYHIPSNKTGYILYITTTVSSNKEADIIMYVRENATDVSAPVSARRLKLYLDGVVGETKFSPKSPQLIGSDCDIWFTGISTANGTEASVDFEILLIDN